MVLALNPAQFEPIDHFVDHPARNDGSEKAYFKAKNIAEKNNRATYVYEDNGTWLVSLMPAVGKPNLRKAYQFTRGGTCIYDQDTGLGQ